MDNPIGAPVDHRPADITDRAFRISLYLKGLDGLMETLGGLFLLIVRPEQINHFAAWLTHGELSQDPRDFIANHILRTAHNLSGSALAFGAAYLLSHGIVKLVLVIEVLRDKLWAYPALIVVIGLFIVYQIYRMAVDGFSWGMLLLTIFDFIVVYLTVKEYRRHKLRHEQRHNK